MYKVLDLILEKMVYFGAQKSFSSNIFLPLFTYSTQSLSSLLTFIALALCTI